jgi:hypothetical protein
MAKIKAVLTLTVHYEDESGKMSDHDMMAEAKANLENLCNNAASNGLMSGNSEMIVETWDAEVKTNVKQD